MITENDIQSLYNKFDVPENIRLHMMLVSCVSVYLGEKINAISKKSVNINDLKSAALIHDIAKMSEFTESNDNNIWLKLMNKYNKVGHAKALKSLLRTKKYKKIVKIASKHEIQSVIDSNQNNRPSTLEEKILYYADKRVEGQKIVTLKNRMRNCIKKYHGTKIYTEKDILMVQAAEKIEKELCIMAEIKPTDINKKTIRD